MTGNRGARPSVATIAILLAVLGSAPALRAQSETMATKYIEYSSLKVREDGKDRIIELKAKTSVLPPGTKVEFLLSWQYQVIQRWTVEVPQDRRFDQEFKVKNYVASPEPYLLMTHLLEPKDQPRAIRKAIEEDAKTFPPGGVPWAEFHEEHKFRLASPAEIEAELGRVRAWFQERYTALGGHDRTVDTQADAASAGTDFTTSSGEFDERKWRKMMDSDVIQPIVDLQADLEKKIADPGDMLPYRRSLATLRELANAVAWRAVDRSIALYKEKGLEPVAEDSAPKDLKTTVRGFRRTPPKSSDLVKMVQSIQADLAPPEPEPPPAPPGGSGPPDPEPPKEGTP